MIIIQVSLYPTGTAHIEELVQIFWDELKNQNIEFKVTPMSTVIIYPPINNKDNAEIDEEKALMSVFKAYKKARLKGKAVIVLTLTTGTKEELKKTLEFA